jgi:hypothetical protein
VILKATKDAVIIGLTARDLFVQKIFIDIG